jgi:omega-amidase
MSALTVTTVQPDLVWEDKAANLRNLEARIMAIADPAEVVVLPEMFSTGFSMRPASLAEPMDGPTVGWMREIAARRRIILTGSVIIEEEGCYYNRLIWMRPDGQFGFYDKRHRFAFAGEDEHYTAGHRRLIASVNGWRVLLLVCYDLRFPVWSRQDPVSAAARAETAKASGREAQPGELTLEYDCIIYVANWPERRALAWKTLLQARAIENQCYVVGVNRIGIDGNNIYHSGDSMIVGPLGEIHYHGIAKEEVHSCTLHKERLDEVRQRFPFWRDADLFKIEL